MKFFSKRVKISVKTLVVPLIIFHGDRMPKILVVDDEKLIVKGLKFSLEKDKMDVDVAYDGEEALTLATNDNYDLIVLDVMLPKANGLEVCQSIREFSDVPIIMLTAKGEDMDKIMGLEYGADDYITKPFNVVELKARIRAILRRSARQMPLPPEKDKTITIRDLVIDTEHRRVFIKSKEVDLTVKEFALLELLMLNESKVYSREELLANVWTSREQGDVRTVDVHVRRIREKIEDNPSEPQYLFTKWGVGYYFR